MADIELEIDEGVVVVTLANAKRIFYSAETCDANEAQRIGLVDRVNADPLAEAKGFLKRVGKNAPLSVAGAAKREPRFLGR